MEKVICDMCGTTYSVTAAQCPICGYARQEDAKVISDPDSGSDSTYSKVKGGRFSASNVRKMNAKRNTHESDDDSDEPEKTNSGLNLALAITAIVLFILLVVVLISFGMKIAKNTAKLDPVDNTETVVQPKDIKCESITVNSASVELAAAGDMHVIYVTVEPANATETVTYSSNNPSIASVDENGRITAVGSGEAIITVSCGDVSEQVAVNCAFNVSQEDNWSLNREEFSLLNKGDTWDLYTTTSTVSKVHIQWSSDDETVASVESGIVTAVGNGSTYIHAEYNGKKLSCKVLCKFQDDTAQEETKSDIDLNTLRVSDKDCDVTLVANGKSYEKSFELYLVDGKNNRVDVTWTASKDGIVSIDGSTITGIKAGSVVVLKATYEGKNFECTIRVRNS